MSVLSVTAVAQPLNVPPRVKVTVTDSGTPAVTSATVTRTDALGVTTTVRTNDGGPLTLLPGGTLFDYEVPFGATVTYSTVQQPTVVSSPVTVNAESVWLVDPWVPDRSMPVEFRANSLAEEERESTVEATWPMRRRTPIVLSDGQRKAPRGSFIAGTESTAEFQAIKALTESDSVLLLNVPPLLGLQIETCYISVGTVTNKRLTDVGSDVHRDIVMPYQVAARPAGGQLPQWSWDDVAAEYGPWNTIMAAGLTWDQVMQEPTS